MNRQETAAALVIMRTIWPNIAVDDATIQAWQWALGDMPMAVVEPELKRWMRTSPFPPKPAEILALIAERATDLPTPDAAWGMVLERTSWPRITGAIGPVVWNVPAEVRAALRQVKTISALRESETPAADRKAFIAAYTGIRTAAIEAVQAGERPPVLRRIARGIFANDAALLPFSTNPESLPPPADERLS